MLQTTYVSKVFHSFTFKACWNRFPSPPFLFSMISFSLDKACGTDDVGSCSMVSARSVHALWGAGSLPPRVCCCWNLLNEPCKASIPLSSASALAHCHSEASSAPAVARPGGCLLSRVSPSVWKARSNSTSAPPRVSFANATHRGSVTSFHKSWTKSNNSSRSSSTMDSPGSDFPRCRPSQLVTMWVTTNSKASPLTNISCFHIHKSAVLTQYINFTHIHCTELCNLFPFVLLLISHTEVLRLSFIS